MELSARDIQEKQFHDAWRGYRQEEVDDFLDQVSEAIDYYQRENAALRERAHEFEQAVSTARDTEEMLKKTLVTAQRAAEEAIASAKAKAERIVGDAEQHAARREKEAKERSVAADAEVRRKLLEADRAQTLRKRELEAAIEALTAHESELRLRLKTFLEQQLKTIDSLSERDQGDARRPHPAGAEPKAAQTRSPQAVGARAGEATGGNGRSGGEEPASHKGSGANRQVEAQGAAGGQQGARGPERSITLPEAEPRSASTKPKGSGPESTHQAGRRSIFGLFNREEGRANDESQTGAEASRGPAGSGDDHPAAGPGNPETSGPPGGAGAPTGHSQAGSPAGDTQPDEGPRQPQARKPAPGNHPDTDA